MGVQRKTALVTGGAVRIGKAIVEQLAAAGYGVVIHANQSLRAATTQANAIRRHGGRAWVVCGALDGEAECRAVIESAHRLAGRLDVLVNNAAVFHKDGIETVTEAALLADMRINCFVPVLLTRYFAERSRKGCVINLLDRRVASHDSTCIPYLLSKTALAEFTRTAALALAPRIRVNGVAPGAVLPPPGKGRAHLRDSAGPVPLQRQVTPRDVAEAVLALAGAEAITGQIVFVDGGQHLLGEMGLRGKG
jgi:pteridine reductase